MAGPGKLAPVQSYSDFFSAAATAAGALTGLLFVALSISPDRLREIEGNLEHQAVAATAFTALVDILFVSLGGLTPGDGGTQITSVIMGLIGLSSTAGLAWRMWQARETEVFTKRWPVLLAIVIVMYAAQVTFGGLARTAQDSNSVSEIFMFIMFAVGIGRSWELLGLNGGGPLAILGAGLHRHDQPDSKRPTEEPPAAE